MKKLLILSMLSVLFSCNSDENNMPNDLFVDNVLGNAKTLTYNKYYVDESVMQIQKATLESKKVITYNENGFILSEINYDVMNNIRDKSEYSYDSDGKRQSKISTDGTGGNAKTITYYYDSKGYQIKALYEEAGLPVGNFIEFELDDNKNKVAEKFFRGSDSTQYARVEYQYNDDKKITLRRALNMSGGITDSYTQSFDEKGNLKSFKAYNPDGSIKAIIFYTYDNFDEVGNWMLRYEYYGDNEKPFLITEREIEYYNSSL